MCDNGINRSISCIAISSQQTHTHITYAVEMSLSTDFKIETNFSCFSSSTKSNWSTAL